MTFMFCINLVRKGPEWLSLVDCCRVPFWDARGGINMSKILSPQHQETKLKDARAKQEVFIATLEEKGLSEFAEKETLVLQQMGSP